MKKWILIVFACCFMCSSVFAEVCQVPEKLMLRPTGLSYRNNQLYVLGQTYGTFYAINLISCQTTFIAGGQKNGFVLPFALIHNDNDNQWIISDAATGLINIKNNRIVGMLGQRDPNGITKLNHDVFVINNTAIFKLNTQTGNETILSDANHGSGPIMVDLRSIAGTQNRLFALDYRLKKIFKINPKNGNRSVFVDLTQFKNNGVQAEQPLSIAASEHDLFVTDPQAKEIIEINLTSHQASVLNSNVLQKNDPMIAPFGIAYDHHLHQLYVSDYGANAIYLLPINPSQSVAKRYKIASIKINRSYPHLAFPAELMMSPNGNIIVADERFPEIFSVNPKTGETILLSGSEKGNGPLFTQAVALNRLASGDILFSDTFFARFYLIDANGNRSTFAPQDKIPPGDPWGLVQGNKHDWYVSDNGHSSIFKLHFNKTNHTVRSQLISGEYPGLGNKGTGPKLEHPLGIAWLPQEKKLIVGNNASTTHSAPALLLIDPTTGNRSVLSGETRGTGPQFNCVGGIIYRAPNTVYAADCHRPALFRVDIKTGNRTIVSGKSDQGKIIGKGPAFGVTPAVTLSADGKTAYVSDVKRDAIFSVDLKTGDRRIIAWHHLIR